MKLSIPSAVCALTLILASVLAHAQAPGPPLEPQDGSRELRLIAVGTEAEALEILDMLAAGTDFGTLARARSIDSTGAADGYLGEFTPEALNEQFRTALASVEPGGVTPPVRLGSRFVLLRWGPPAANPWQAAHDRAVEAFSAGDYTVAGERFSEAIREAERFAGPDLRLARSLTGLAETYRLEGVYAASQPLYEQVLEIREALQGPDAAELAPVLNNLGEAYRLSGDPASAREAFDRALRILEANGADELDVALILGNLAETDRDLGQPSRAAEALDRSIGLLESRLAPDDPALLASLGSRAALALEAGRDPEATGLSRRVLDARWSGRGGESLAAVFDAFADVVRLAYFRDGELTEALSALRNALAATPPTEALYVPMRDLLLAAQYIEGAEAVMQEAVRAYPASPGARLALAEVYLRAGFLIQAKELLAEVASMLPSQPEGPARQQMEYRVYLRTGELARSMGSTSEAILAYRRAQTAEPESNALRIALGDLLMETGRLEEAGIEYRRALEGEPELADARRGLADLAMRRGDFAEAASQARRAVELDPQLLTAQYDLAMALIRTGETDAGEARLDAYRAARSELQEANGAAGRIAVRVRAAMSDFAAGEPEQAIGQLGEAIRERAAGPSIAATWSPDTNLSVLYLKLGDYAAASGTLTRALGAGCCDPGAGFLVYRNLWHVARAVGDDQSRDHYEALYLRDLADALGAQAP